MKVYGDTSFVIKLVAEEPDAPEAIAEFRRLLHPRLPFTSLHELEVTNAIRQSSFHKRRNAPAAERAGIVRERDSALMRLETWLTRGWLLETAVDFERAFARARELSEKHTERLGCRGFDLLHVAVALELRSEVFLTSDSVQADLARAEGLDVRSSSREQKD